jgi:arylformamidase
MSLLRIFLVQCLLVVLALAAYPPPLAAQALRERLQQAREASRRPAARPAPLPEGARALSDIAYGSEPRQRLDVYLPAQPRHAPILFFVHGGGWANGNKDNPGVVEHKAAHWLPKGYILVSANYRMLPDADPLVQAQDVATALATVQRRAAQWNADPARVVLMGHSAGAHLLALIGASPARWLQADLPRPLGVVALDSAAMNVPQSMQRPPLPGVYRKAFGSDTAFWESASPWHQLTRQALPMLMVCSTRRADPCSQAEALKTKAASLGVAMRVLPQPLNHGQINHTLGTPSAYTEAVDGYIAGLLPH